MTEHTEHLRILEAVLFAATEPLDDASIKTRMPEDADLQALLIELQEQYAPRGVNLVRVNDRWMLRTATDLAQYLRTEVTLPRKLSRAGIETLAIIAYHQPITRAEIEDIRGVTVSRGTIDTLLEAGWIRPGKRRETPGQPLTWLTSGDFLVHFGLESLDALPGIEELKAAGLLDKRPALAAIGGHPSRDGEDTGENRPVLPDETEGDMVPEDEEGADDPREAVRD